jgi:hypothetical protein
LTRIAPPSTDAETEVGAAAVLNENVVAARAPVIDCAVIVTV